MICPNMLKATKMLNTQYLTGLLRTMLPKCQNINTKILPATQGDSTDDQGDGQGDEGEGDEGDVEGDEASG